jgi:hypothetical protein
MRLPKVAVAIVLMTLFVTARAQDGVLDLTGWGIYGMEEAVMDAARSGSGTKKKVTKKAPTVRLSYTPSAARRKEFMKTFVAKMRTQDPQTAAGMEKLIAQKDLIAEMGKIMAPYGLRTDNVADAYTLWWVASWHASRSQEFKPNRSQLQAVKAQASRALSVAMKSSKITDATRQQFAEACLMQALLIDGALEKAQGNPSQLKEVARHVSQGARASGLNLAVMELTPKGFVLKG